MPVDNALVLSINIGNKAFCFDDLLHKLRERLSFKLGSFCAIIDHAAVKIHFYVIAVLDAFGCFRTLDDRQSDVDRIAVENTCKGLCDDTAYTCCLMAIGACSLEDPQPKFFSATMISPL